MSTVTELALTDFRCYRGIEVALSSGITVILGSNGQGKTSLLEGIGWAATGRSFRGVSDATLVRAGCNSAFVRVAALAGERPQLLEAEVRAVGRNRLLLNRHPLGRVRDLLGFLRITVFAPDDLELVKGGPSRRRDYLDDLLVAISSRYGAARSDYERVLRQRNALLRQGVRDRDAMFTLEVFDDQLAAAGAELVRGRLRLVERLSPAVTSAYRSLADEDLEIDASYETDWAGDAILHATGDSRDDTADQLRRALLDRRQGELDRGLTLVGPHRDEWRLRVRGLDARTHASQGEQRTLSLSLRLAGHHVCTQVVGEEPVLLLDDVFSELDRQRASALVANLPSGQTLVTTASTVPPEIHPERRLQVSDGRLEEAA